MPHQPSDNLMRLCVGCRKLIERQKLVRVMAIRAQGPLVMPVSTTPVMCWFMPNEPIGKNQGRSAYLCLDEACLATALKRKSLSRALKCTLPSDMLSKLTADFKNRHYYR